MKLILMRHGQAGYQVDGKVTADAERQLTALGKQQARQTAEAILSRYQPDLCVVSPYIRAKQTLDAFEPTQVPVVELAGIIPDANPLKALHALLDIALDAEENRKATGATDTAKLECVLVVCHMPIVAKMAGLLTAQAPEPYSLAEARVFDTELIAPDMAIEVDRFVSEQS